VLGAGVVLSEPGGLGDFELSFLSSLVSSSFFSSFSFSFSFSFCFSFSFSRLVFSFSSHSAFTFAISSADTTGFDPSTCNVAKPVSDK